MVTMNPSSLCETCSRMREVVTPKGSRFLLCQMSWIDARYAKYPPQPVVRCEGHRAAGEPEAEPDDGEPGEGTAKLR
jgi:hypothetical protein